MARLFIEVEEIGNVMVITMDDPEPETPSATRWQPR